VNSIALIAACHIGGIFVGGVVRGGGGVVTTGEVVGGDLVGANVGLLYAGSVVIDGVVGAGVLIGIGEVVVDASLGLKSYSVDVSTHVGGSSSGGGGGVVSAGGLANGTGLTSPGAINVILNPFDWLIMYSRIYGGYGNCGIDIFCIL
jgi:hypothetical protein